jgi:hypothetical protein
MNKAEARAEGLKLLKVVQRDIDPKAKLKVVDLWEDEDFNYEVTLCNGTVKIWQGQLSDTFFCVISSKCGFNMQGVGKTPYGAFMKLYKQLDRHFNQVNNALDAVFLGWLFIRDKKLGVNHEKD